MSTFGPEFNQVWPKANAALKLTDFGKKQLERCESLSKPDPSGVDIEQFIQKSAAFPVEFPIRTCRVMSQPKERYPVIEQQIASAYPVIHERVLALYLAFLEHKCKYGNKRELEIYKNLTLIDFVQRLLTKRCVSFFGKNDKYLLLSSQRGCSGFMEVGTDAENPPLLLQNVLSYDEVKLSALLSVSSHSEFINDGNRQNCGVIEKNKSRIERAGVVVGIIGARLSRRDVMEFQDIVIAKTQNTKENGYGQSGEADTRAKDYRRVWKEFYEQPDLLYEQVTKDGKRFGDARNKNDIFDNLLMKKRYAISFDTLLLESEARAAAAGKRAFIHVVGIGLGVWRVAEQQEKIFLEAFGQRLETLLPRLPHVSVVHFSWFHLSEWGVLKNGGVLKSEAHPDGNEIELEIYGNLTLAAFVQRLLSKRCVSFVGASDYYHLLNGKQGHGGFREVGTTSESAPLTLQNVLSYDEMKLSAFLSVSSHTEFINNGTRRNAGVVEHDKSKIETDGVVIGLIGSRFHAEGMMEWQDILITAAQNTKQNGYGLSEPDVRRNASRSADYRQLWRDFYEEHDFTYDTVKKLKSPRFYSIPNHSFIFDNLVMKKRFTVSFDTLLLEAQARGAAAQRQVYVHVVGIGLGVWRAVGYQEQVFLEAFTQRLLALLDKLPHVSVVHFSWFGTDQWGQLKDGGKFVSETHPDGGITTFLSNRNPAEKLSPEYRNMLMVVSYAWDSNALPGNEFWSGSLTSSSDPAAASSTLITELHNAHINRAMVCGDNLHVASAKYGVLHISDYAKKILQ